MNAKGAKANSEDDGLICGWLFDPGQPPREATLAEVAAAMAAGVAGRFCWLHFNLAHMGSHRWLAEAGLSPAFHEALRDELRSTRIERDEQALVAVLNDVAYDFRYEPSEIATLWVSVDRRQVVTARRSPLSSTDRLRQALRAGAPIASPIELLERLLQQQARSLVEIVRHVTREVDRTEDQLLAGRVGIKRATLGAQRRLLVRLQRLLAPEPSSIFRLLQHPPQWLVEGEAQKLREATEEFSVVLQDMASLQERIKLLQEELGALQAERTGRSLFVLTVFTVLALPMNIVAGLFGMNVGGIPFSSDGRGFWIVTGVLAVFMGAAARWVFRKGGGLD